MTHYAFTPRHIAAMKLTTSNWKFWINSSTWLYNTRRRVQLNRYPFQSHGNLSFIRASSSKFPVLHPILHSWQQPLSAVAKLFLNSPETLLVSNPPKSTISACTKTLIPPHPTSDETVSSPKPRGNRTRTGVSAGWRMDLAHEPRNSQLTAI